MLDLASSYFNENYGSKTITDNEKFFIIYEIYDDQSMYIRHMYIAPEHRGKVGILNLFNMVVDKEKPKYVFCTVEKLNKNWDRLAHIYIRKGGFCIDEITEDKVRLYKEL